MILMILSHIEKKFLHFPFWPALNIFILLKFILHIGRKAFVISVTVALLCENKIHPSEEQLLKLFASEIF